ncbi:MAG: hypothetical protein ACR2RV_05425 [Verrucomicrobiales bacterium]
MNHQLKLALLATLPIVSPVCRGAEFKAASTLSDLSGLAWMGGDRFLGVHDAKTDDEPGLSRVSILQLPKGLGGITFTSEDVSHGGVESNDLESASRVPGANLVILAESGDNQKNLDYQRLFRAEVDGDQVRITGSVRWPMKIYNVEASAIAKTSDGYLFLYAERAEKQPSTELRFASFDPEKLSFGEFRSVTVNNPAPDRFNRPLVALDVGPGGEVFIAAAYDAEAAGLPDPDNGPFRSGVYRIGKVSADGDVSLAPSPTEWAILDGMKVESVAIQESDEGIGVFVGFDDENYGATLRLLPKPPEFD